MLNKGLNINEWQDPDIFNILFNYYSCVDNNLKGEGANQNLKNV